METRSKRRNLHVREISPSSSSNRLQKKKENSLEEKHPSSKKEVHISSPSTEMGGPLNYEPSSVKRVGSYTDEWHALEVELAKALGSLHGAGLLSTIDMERVSARFKRFTTNVLVYVFLRLNQQEDQLRMINELLNDNLV